MINPKKIDKLSRIVINLIVLFICLVLLFIIIFILSRGLSAINFKFLTSPPEDFAVGGGIGPELFNSFYLLVITLIISVPISLGAAIYLSEYADDNALTRIIRTSIEVLSSLPSIVVGLFGFAIFVIKFHWSFSILSGAFALTIFNLPILVRVMEQSLRNIPDSQREATLALGLTKWECTKKVLIPSALPSILTGIILSAGRIFGEAAALIYTAGQTAPRLNFHSFNIFSINCPWNIMRPAETLAVHIWKVNSEGIVPDAEFVSNGTAAVLIISILLFNIIARVGGKMLYKKITSSSK